MGSRGSVIPKFLESRAQGIFNLTDKRMTRFTITLQQAGDFVLHAVGAMWGSEIFVPKIPSMKLTELANVIAPGMPIEVIGIRPGEKLHEVMITSDEARFTVELPDRYIIAPHIYGPIPTYHEKQTSVAEDFHYSSENNDWWLTEEEAKVMVEESYNE